MDTHTDNQKFLEIVFGYSMDSRTRATHSHPYRKISILRDPFIK